MYRKEDVGLKKVRIIRKYVKFGAISWKLDILSVTARLKFEV